MQRDLVVRAQRGDLDAFSALTAGTTDRLFGAARLILRDDEHAADAVQDALLQAWLDLRGLRDPDRFDAWLHRLLAHACLDLIRRRRRRPIEVELTNLDTTVAGDPAHELADRELLGEALARLEPEWRAIVVLHYLLGMPLPEVAASLGIPLGTAKSRLHRAVGVMRATVTGDSGPGPVPPSLEGVVA